MKVQEAIDYLAKCNPDAELILSFRAECVECRVGSQEEIAFIGFNRSQDKNGPVVELKAETLYV